MKLAIKPNPDNLMYRTAKRAVNENGGYCPCKLEKNEDTKCPCKQFLTMDEPGACECGRYIKEEV